jgi:four helix bundle protein
MSKKTPTAQQQVVDVQWLPNRRMCEDAPVYAVLKKTDSTPNAQCSRPNAQRAGKPRFDLEDRLLEFSAWIVRLVDSLPNARAANPLGGQLLRCGTSLYGNHGEVEAAESRKDFVHKLKVCLKDLKETPRWSCLIAKSSMIQHRK